MTNQTKTSLNILSIILFLGATAWTYKTWFDYEPFLALVGSIIALIGLNFNTDSNNLAKNSSWIFGNKNKLKQKTNKENSSTMFGSENDVEQ